MTKKGTDIMRIGFQNFNGLSSQLNDPVDDSVRHWITDNDFDIFGISEMNLWWPAIPASLQFRERIREWWDPRTVRSIFTYNRHDKREAVKKKRTQYGGTAQISRHAAALRMIDQGIDPEGLGRWCWQLYRGKNNSLLRVITAYRPNFKDSAQFQTVYIQHRKRFLEQGQLQREPRQALLDDLSQVIYEWKEAGEHIVLMMDANEDVRTGKMKHFLEQTDMRDVVISMHGNDAPHTHIDGSKPIDGIFATRSVECVQAGYSSFGDGVQGKRPDHRCIWMDVRLQTVFGHRMPPVQKAAFRRVKCNDPRVVAKFNLHYKNFAYHHDLGTKIFQTESDSSYPPTHQALEQADIVAELRYQGIVYADTKCRRAFTGDVPFSQEYKTLALQVGFWNHLAAKKDGRKVGSRLLGRFLIKLKDPTPLRDYMALTKAEVDAKSKAVHILYRKFKKEQATESRATWLEQLAESRAKHEQERMNKFHTRRQRQAHHQRKKKKLYTSAQELTKLRATEALRQIYRNINYAVGKDKLAGISLVIAPNSQGDWTECTSKDDIENACINEAQRRFHQTAGTPPMTAPLNIQLGYMGIGTESDSILNGEYESKPGTNPYAQLLLTSLSRVAPNEDELEVGISTESYIAGWKKAKENTASGPTNVHFGHCKAIAQDPELAAMEAAFLSIPMRTGRPYKQWQKGTDCELMKKANSFRVDKLRKIVVIQSDANFCNKQIAHKTAQRGETPLLPKDGPQRLAREQAGSRKRHRAIEQALNKRLTFDFLRQLKWPGIMVPNNLKSCYDQICHSIGSLCLRRQGVAESEVVFVFTLIQNLEHEIRTAYGDSDKCYGGEREIWAVPMQGVYQGNGGGPTIWAVVSSPLLQIMKKEGFGTFFKASITNGIVRIVGYAFVDDTDLVQTGKDGSESSLDVLKKMQDGLDLWEGLVSATGGAIEVSKSTWWLIDFIWDANGKWRYATKADIPAELWVKDVSGARQAVPRLETSQSFNTLGVHLGPDGSQLAAYEYLKETAKTWADKLRTSFLKEKEANAALKTTILKKLEYPLPALTLSEKQCNAIIQPVLNAALPKAKFNRNFPRASLYGPGSHQGCEIHNLYTSQVIEHLDAALRHGPFDTMTGELLRGSLEALTTELGLPGKPLSYSYRAHSKLVTDCWWKDVWRETDEGSIRIDSQTEALPLQRANDQFLMTEFIANEFKNNRLVRLNRCRLFLQVYTLADICSGNGRRLCKEFFDGRNPMPGSSRLSWPNQGNPPPADWKLWQQAIRKCFLTSRSDMRLRRPLGRWLLAAPAQWPCWYDVLHNCVYLLEEGKWREFRPSHPGLQLQPTYIKHSLHDDRPPNTLQAIGWFKDNLLTFTGRARGPDATLAPPSSIDDTIASYDPSLQWALNFIERPDDLTPIVASIRDGTAAAVTDGSFKLQRGTAAFTLVDLASGVQFTGANHVPGLPTDQCAYRSELTGILGTVILIDIVCQFFQITSGQVTIGCDNLEAGRHGIYFESPPSPSDDHFDIISAIFDIKKRLPVSLIYRHVEGHQRERYPGRPLDSWALLNDDMDTLAKAYWLICHPQNMPATQQVRNNEWAIWIDNEKICKNFKHAIREKLQQRRLEQWWKTTKKLDEDQIQAIDFTVAGQAWKSVWPSRRRYIAKFAANYSPVGRNMKRWRFWKTSQCPRCLQPNETCDHVIQCQDPRAVTTREAALLTLSSRLEEIHTEPQIQHVIEMFIRWWTDKSDTNTTDVSVPIQRALDQQFRIGWDQFMRGRIGTRWAIQQAAYFTDHKVRQTGQKWASLLIKAVWEFTWSLWDHRNEILHHSDVHDTLLDMDAVDLSIIEEWHAGSDDLIPMDRMQFRGLDLETLLAKRSRFRREWLSFVQIARMAVHTRVEENEEM